MLSDQAKQLEHKDQTRMASARRQQQRPQNPEDVTNPPPLVTAHLVSSHHQQGNPVDNEGPFLSSHEEGPTPSVLQEQIGQLRQHYQRLLNTAIGIVFLLLAILVVAGTLCGTSTVICDRANRNPTSSSMNVLNLTTVPATQGPSFPAPTKNPTERLVASPTTNPTTKPFAAPALDLRAETIASHIIGLSLAERTIRYPTDEFPTPEETALQWVIHEDPLQETSMEFILQRYVLAVLWFSSTAAEPWEQRSQNWLSAAHECTWQNVECNSEQEVTRVDLDRNNSTGTIPPDLGLLTHLTFLSMSRNKLTGTLPSSIGQLSHLDTLYFGINALTGTIPGSYGQLTRLRQFSVDNNRLTGSIPELNSEYLYKLWFYGNKLTGTMPLCKSQQAVWSWLVADCNIVFCPCCSHCCPSSEGSIPQYNTQACPSCSCARVET